MYSPFIRFLFFGWWGGTAAPLQCLLLSDSDVAHHGCLLSRNLFENSGELLFELVEVDDGSAKAVSDPILHIAGNTVEEQGVMHASLSSSRVSEPKDAPTALILPAP